MTFAKEAGMTVRWITQRLAGAVRLGRLGMAGVAGVGVLLAAACGSGQTSHSATADAVVQTATNSKLGSPVLVDPRGMTLYALSAERAGRFICTKTADLPGTKTSCLSLWKPLTVPRGQVPTGSVNGLGIVHRPDGAAPQVTYHGMPLYTFVDDQHAGQETGNGFHDVGTWHAVTTNGSLSGGQATTGGGLYGGY
jgi:predicted lipoprotein with Yx(FWY)xxD motif